MSDFKIIFMGTPEFAVPSLEILIENNFKVVAVITAPDKPQGRGQKLTYSPVKECALKHNIPVLQPTNLKSPQFIEELRSYQATLQVVVAFRMLPEVVWAMPTIGTFNLHASLLPQYRGAAPINWAIINGETETGVTTFFLQHDIDTGAIILQEKEPIYPEDNAGTLYERLMTKGAQLVLKTVEGISEGKYQSIPQPKIENARHAPKIFRETCEINWQSDAENVVNFVRGLSPYPSAWTSIQEKNYKIHKVSAIQMDQTGDWFTDHKTVLARRVNNSWISIDEIQPEGKRKMPVAEFLRGNKLTFTS